MEYLHQDRNILDPGLRHYAMNAGSYCCGSLLYPPQRNEFEIIDERIAGRMWFNKWPVERSSHSAIVSEHMIFMVLGGYISYQLMISNVYSCILQYPGRV